MGFSDLMASLVDKNVRQVLGENVTYTPSGGGPVVVRGVFDEAYVRVDAGRPGVSSSGPAVFLRLSELPSNPSDDAATVIRGGVTYSIREAQPDGIGGVWLLLHKV